MHLIGRGGTGEVFSALELSTGSRIALRRLLPSAGQQRARALNFTREYYVLFELRQPRIIAGYNTRRSHGKMELLDGADLRELLSVPCSQPRAIASKRS